MSPAPSAPRQVAMGRISARRLMKLVSVDPDGREHREDPAAFQNADGSPRRPSPDERNTGPS